MKSKLIRGLFAAGMLSLTACGGSGEGSSNNKETMLLSSITATSDTTTAATSTRVTMGGASETASATTAITATVDVTTPASAAHFLSQATFGPTAADIASLQTTGTTAWLTSQFALPTTSHRDFLYLYGQSLPAGQSVTSGDFQNSFWRQALSGKDQLRQRVAYALSQIFVISTADGSMWTKPLGVAAYYDMLNKNAFGNFRTLLEDVALHPMMGVYLSHIHNQKEDGVRMPDENFAREIMQLMTIGLYKLNADGTQVLVNGKPVETYTHDDVMGLAKVFTGWSWAAATPSQATFYGTTAWYARDWTPMQNYAQFHSTSDKNFLGTTVSGGGSGASDLKVALDTLFNHPNVGPFIGRQLIQRLVKSNPSPAYVARVAAAFANNGSGVRGDLKAVVQAILLDSEASDTTTTKKVREPVLRLANWARAFNAWSTSGWYLTWPLDDPTQGIAQQPLKSPSVFNFYRPSYTPPNSALATAGLVAPEMQIAGEPSVIGYLNYMQEAIRNGAGKNFDLRPEYYNERALIFKPDQLVDRINLLLMSGTMSSTLRAKIISAVNSIEMLTPNSWNATLLEQNKQYRVCLAIFLTMASPEYLAQK